MLDTQEERINRTVAANIRRLRKEKQMTQQELCDAAGVSHRTIYAVETSQFGVRLVTAVRIANALGCTLEDLTREL